MNNSLLPWLLKCCDRDPETGEAAWPKVWHPEDGVIRFEVDSYGEVCGHMKMGQVDVKFKIDADYLAHCKILLKPFSSLVAQVRVNPGDNDAVTAFGGFIKEYKWLEPCTNEEITVWLDEINNITINQDWKFKPNGNYFFDYSGPRDYLLRAGYNVPRVPSELVINPEELE